MSVFHNNILAGASGAGGDAAAFQIDRSLRFDSNSSANLSKTISSSGNRRTWTLSWWMKLGNLGVNRGLFGMPGTSTSSPQFYSRIGSDDRLYVYEYNTSGTYQFLKRTDAVLRDPSAWYHCVFQFDSTQSTAEDGFKIYINGTRVTSWETNNLTNYAQNYDGAWNSSVNTGVHRIGRSDDYFDGYMAEIHFVDGTALAATDFGEYDSNNVWQPKQYSGSYGTNGFHLDLSDNTSTTTIAEDSSGNNNDFTANNISVTAGAENDSMIDSPTNYTSASGNNGGNYATLNPLDFASSGSPILRNGNLDAAADGGWQTVAATIGNFTSGKWYWEVKLAGGSGHRTGLSSVSRTNASNSQLLGSGDIALNSSDGRVYVDGTAVGTGAGNLSGKTAGIALNLDADSVSFYQNGSLVHTVSSLSSTASWTPVHAVRYGTNFDNINFGQRPFAYTPPSGHLSICTQNLSNPAIADGSTAMNIKTWSGDSTERAITGYNFSPDFVWIKTRSTTDEHVLSDIVRGAGKVMSSSAANKESDFADPGYWGHVKSFDSDGFTLDNGAGGYHRVNLSGRTYVGWAWDGGTSTVSNTDGSRATNVRANTTAGFSIVTFNDGNSANTYGHGLNAAPEFIVVKSRGGDRNWFVYHSALGATKYIRLDKTSAASTANHFNNTAPTSSVFSLGSDASFDEDQVAYCWTPVSGFSSFGSYTGLGGSVGPFVFTGFKPAWLMVKNATASGGNWMIYDNTRVPYNLNNAKLAANLTGQENESSTMGGTSLGMDFLSNGFKYRGDGGGNHNSSGQTYIFAAFAEHPFKTARAR